jgi:hypothetical protein
MQSPAICYEHSHRLGTKLLAELLAEQRRPKAAPMIAVEPDPIKFALWCQDEAGGDTRVNPSEVITHSERLTPVVCGLGASCRRSGILPNPNAATVNRVVSYQCFRLSCHGVSNKR